MAEKNTTIAAATLVVVLAAAVSVSLPSGALAGGDFVARACESAHNARCVAVLETDPQSARAATVEELAGIGIDNAAAAARAGRDAAVRAKVGGGSEGGSPASAALADCVGFYADAVRALDGARAAFDAGAFGDAEARASAAEDAGERCEKAFAGRGLRPALSGVDERMTERGGVASDLVDSLFIVPSRRLLRA